MINNKTYDVLKWNVITILPALATFVGTIGTAVDWPHTGLTVIVITAIETFLGAVVGVSGVTYSRKKAEDDKRN
ncbi:MAG: phage holin [Streptococcaceae bacterium]|nr:phage holin [Streptococcaceae bacterium]